MPIKVVQLGVAAEGHYARVAAVPVTVSAFFIFVTGRSERRIGLINVLQVPVLVTMAVVLLVHVPHMIPLRIPPRLIQGVFPET